MCNIFIFIESLRKFWIRSIVILKLYYEGILRIQPVFLYKGWHNADLKNELKSYSFE